MCPVATFLRIYGDNIIECERAIELIAQAFVAEIQWVSSFLHKPQYHIIQNNEILF